MCLDECRCREYASPSLTWSKVGVVLHLQWGEEDGGIFTIDVDLNWPTWPTHTRFNGSIKDYGNYLMRERPVGWLEEYSKLEMMTAACASAHLLTSNIIWPVKFRLINRDTVLPSQVTNLILLCIIFSPDPSFHERSNPGGKEDGRLCSSQDPEILH